MRKTNHLKRMISLSKKLTKDDVRSPDQVLKTLNKGFEWTQAHSKLLLAALVLFLVTGIGYSIFSSVSANKETQAQGEYFKFEKDYLEKKRGFDEAQRIPNLPPDAKKNPTEPVKAKPTGDLEKDYGPEVAGFQKVLTDFPSSKAAQMAAINLSEIYLDYKNTDGAFQALEKVAPHSKGQDLISAVVATQLGNVLSEKGECKAALDHWQNVLANSNVKFMHDTVRMKSAFCYEKINDTAKAEEMFKKVSQNSQDPKSPQMGETGLGKEAEKYLRLLKLKKSPEGKGS
jgi:predicted negative regulator of RcsB-dependent stress response